MNRNYSVEGTFSTAADTGLAVIGSASVQPAVFYISFSCAATPADVAAELSIKHSDGTGAGTKTAVTPEPLVGGGTAAVAGGGKVYTAEPTTYSSVALLKPVFNQRSHYQWYANPGKELIVELAANALIGAFLDAFSTGTFAIEGVMHFTE